MGGQRHSFKKDARLPRPRDLPRVHPLIACASSSEEHLLALLHRLLPLLHPPRQLRHRLQNPIRVNVSE